MQLHPEEAKHFFDLMLPLLHFVNLQKNVIPQIKTKEEFLKIPTEKKLKIRNALWQNPSLIDAYISENGSSLPSEDADILLKWKSFVRGSFFIFRQLKKYAILIKDESVYGVVGLHSSLHEAVNEFPLPALVEAVLLPYKGQIIFDGLLETRNIFFGGGIKSSLDDVYNRAKLKNKIITSFEKSDQGIVIEAPLHDWTGLLNEIETLASKVKGENDIQDAAFAVMKAGIGLAKSAATIPTDFQAIEASDKKFRRAYKKLDKILSYLDDE